MEEHTVGVFRNKEQRKIFGYKEDELTAGWKKLHKEKLLKYSSISYMTKQVDE
jgi:hypothetical protein